MKEMQGLIERLVSEKATGIGGSDIGDVMSLPPWGCRRRLWYEKRGVKPDYEDEVNPLLERGLALEAVAVEMYERKTGRRTGLSVPGRPILSPTRLYRHLENPELLVHLDGVVYREPKKKGRPKKGADTSAGVLEIKTVGAHMFYQIKQNGMPEAYIMQVQHAMAVTGLSWGSFGILWPDGWRILTFDFDASKGLQQEAKTNALVFLDEVKKGVEPPRLPPTDNRCGKCAYRSSCQGAALLEATKGQTFVHSADEELVRLAGRYWEFKSMFDEAESLYEGVKGEIKERMGDCVGAQIRGSRIHFKPYQEKRIDTNKLKKNHPTIAEECSTLSVKRALRIYAI